VGSPAKFTKFTESAAFSVNFDDALPAFLRPASRHRKAPQILATHNFLRESEHSMNEAKWEM
jgi:hypothetical protein